YSPELLALFAHVKCLFDPQNLLNPGVLTAPVPTGVATSAGAGGATAVGAVEGTDTAARATRADVEGGDVQPGIDLLDQFLRRPAAHPLPAAGGFAFREDHGDFTTAVHRCTGVGKCRADIAGTFMCPSWKATRDEKDVTRGRARTLQDAANGELIASVTSPEVLEALDLCLACKACSSDCPAGVDMAKYRSETYFRRYRGHLRPLTHYTLGRLPMWTRLTARVPGLAAVANAVMSLGPLRRAAFSVIGLDPRRPMPSLQSGTFQRWASRRGLGGDVAPAVPPTDRATPASAVGAPTAPAPRYAVVWADSFSQTLDDSGARALVDVLEANGFTVLLPPDACCGLTWITTGQLDGARKRLEDLLGKLAPYAVNGIPIVGVEPSCTAVLRDDLLDLLPDDPRAHAVSGAVRTLAELLATVPLEEQVLPDLTGVEVVAQPHCHHHSVMGWSTDRALLDRQGATVTQLDGCCGLAGNFGMERGHYDVSVAVAEDSLLPALVQHPDAVYLADGFSCRTQAEQLAGRGGIHLATLLRQGAGGDPVPSGASARD
ncbi:MAG: 4Fe-4S dicluster domain-containing protein, partial [Pauljensenia sp.]